MWQRIHRNYLPILSGVIFFFIVGVVVVEIDRQIYQDKKKEICIANWERICPESSIEKLMELAKNYFTPVEQMRNLVGDRAQLKRQADMARAALDEETSRILHGDNCLIGIGVYTVHQGEADLERDLVVSHAVDKYRRQHTLANSLVLRRFWGETTRPFVSGSTKQRVGEVVFRYTTPTGFAEIRELTLRYWGLLGAVVVVLGLLYWYILRYLIAPIKLITEQIDRSKGALPEILPQPRTVLESAYNDLARDALLNAVTRTMAEYMSVDRLVERDEIVGNVPEQVAPHFSFAAVHAVEVEVGEGSDTPVRWCRSAHHTQKSRKIPEPTERDWTELGRQFDLDWNQTILECQVTNQNLSCPYFAVPIATDRDNRRAVFLAATPLGSLSQESLRWNRETLMLLADAVRSGLETLDLQRDLILREKSKANISLSRNLGHDLTNVIATSKLELDTVRRFLKLPTERQMQMDPQVKGLFSESLHGLLNNTKFLQEIINIYRSFSYMHRPEYEWTDLNALVDEVAELFQLSVSRRIRIQRSYGSDVPHAYVEPRLLKLAIFNLISNANEALKRRATRDGDFGATLWISTEFDGNVNTITVAVRDNGYGIRNSSGELATPDEVHNIFQAGFTTKRSGMAEGLGLNWVRQIVCEFHHGQLQARNHPERGAEVSIILPRYEKPPDPEARNGGDVSASESVPTPPPTDEGKDT